MPEEEKKKKYSISTNFRTKEKKDKCMITRSALLSAYLCKNKIT